MYCVVIPLFGKYQITVSCTAKDSRCPLIDERLLSQPGFASEPVADRAFDEEFRFAPHVSTHGWDKTEALQA